MFEKIASEFARVENVHAFAKNLYFKLLFYAGSGASDCPIFKMEVLEEFKLNLFCLAL